MKLKPNRGLLTVSILTALSTTILIATAMGIIVNPFKTNLAFQPYSVNVADGDLVITGANWSASFQPQFYLQNDNILTWSQIPGNVDKKLWKQKINDRKWKYGVDFSGITTTQKNNLKYVILHRVGSENLTFDDIRIEGSCIVVSESLPEVRLCHQDILRTYSLPIVNKTDIVIGNLDNTWTKLNGCQNSSCAHLYTTEGNWIDNGDGTWNISFDPTVTIDADDVLVDADLSDLLAEDNCTHLSIDSTAPYDDLVAYWSFDCDKQNVKLTTHYDYSSNGKDGTGVDDVVTNTTHCIDEFGNCAYFDDSGDWITLGNDNDFVPIGSGFAISAWINTRSTADRQYIFATAEDTADESYQLRINNDGTAQLFVFAHTFQYNNIVGGTTLQTDTWYHILGTWDESVMNLYLNGVPDAATAAATGTWSAADGLENRIGAQAAGAAGEFDGMIDEVMFFANNLTAAQAKAIFDNQSARFKETGTLGYMNRTTLGGLTTGFNRVNVSTNIQNLSDSKIELSVGYYDGSWTQTSGQNISNETNFTFTVSSTTTNLTLNYTFYAGDGTYSFYSPLMFPFQDGDIVVTLDTVAGDTCDCTSIQAGTVVDCSENCDIDACDVGGIGITIRGAGNIIISDTVTNFININVEGDSSTSRCNVLCLGGACFGG